MPTANEIVINVQELEPRLRHQTIFEVFDGLKEDESFIIHNNHDPRPVYYQLMDMRGNIFDWEYIQEGPEWWDIRVTRNVPILPDEGRDFIINVPNIEPRQKHETIFKIFDSFHPGESFVIHNDHDPKPLYYQLANMHGETFDWEYLNEGPQWWDIRVTKNEMPIEDAKEGEKVLNIPSLEPRLKHHTIFTTFDDLPYGQSFIIHNDHDPKPVYFQLINLYGEDSFTWEYLQQGPQWYDIRVTKLNKDESAAVSAVSKNEDGDLVIDIPSLEPRLKHPTIFETFDKLQPEESLIIHNDHDPKPVYYQLQSEKGDVFTWVYLQQGPQWWDIKVTRKQNEIMETIGQIVAKDLSKSDVFKKYGIDFCCGGEKTVRQVCAEMGIDPEPVEKELRQPSSGAAPSANLDFDEWDLGFLSDYVTHTHHKYARKKLPEINQYSAKVAQVHGDRHPELHEINRLVGVVTDEMYDHMNDEEQRLFPIIKEIVDAGEEDAPYGRKGDNTFTHIVKEHFKEHEEVGDAIKEIRSLSKNFAIPEDACTSYKLLFKMLEEFEADTFTHIHLENNILFPKASDLELSLQ